MAMDRVFLVLMILLVFLVGNDDGLPLNAFRLSFGLETLRCSVLKEIWFQGRTQLKTLMGWRFHGSTKH